MRNKIIGVLVLALGFVSVPASAAVFDSNLSFGSSGQEVVKLQEFLIDEGCFAGTATGNFFSITRKAVVCYQTKEGISPAAGYWGPLTRAKANEKISIDIEASNAQAVKETGSAPVLVDDRQAKIDELLRQIATLQAAINAQIQTQTQIQQSIQNQTPIIQQIQQNTAPAPVGTSTPEPTSTPSLTQLIFVQTPKLIWSEKGLSSITWETNRPTTLTISPIFPDATGWTTSKGAWESCGRAGLSKQINSTCRIQVKDEHGNLLDHTIEVFKDSVTIGQSSENIYVDSDIIVTSSGEFRRPDDKAFELKFESHEINNLNLNFKFSVTPTHTIKLFKVFEGNIVLESVEIKAGTTHTFNFTHTGGTFRKFKVEMDGSSIENTPNQDDVEFIFSDFSISGASKPIIVVFPGSDQSITKLLRYL